MGWFTNIVNKFKKYIGIDITIKHPERDSVRLKSGEIVRSGDSPKVTYIYNGQTISIKKAGGVTKPLKYRSY